MFVQRDYLDVDRPLRQRLSLDVNDPAPFQGMLINFDTYYWFLKCENAVLQSGVLP